MPTNSTKVPYKIKEPFKAVGAWGGVVVKALRY